MALSAYESFANGPLVFPIGGKNYTLKPVTIPNGRILAGLINGTDKKLSAAPAEELWKLVLGDLWDEFIEDGVPLHAATRAGLTALAEHQYGRPSAEAAWEAGADPKALKEYIESRMPTNRVQRLSSSTAGAKKTPSPVSTKTTTSSRGK
jgi:hypothetical protein